MAMHVDISGEPGPLSCGKKLVVSILVWLCLTTWSNNCIHACTSDLIANQPSSLVVLNLPIFCLLFKSFTFLSLHG